MNKHLSKKYALLGKTPERQDNITVHLRGLFKSPLAQIILFAAVMCVVGNLAMEKILFSIDFKTQMVIDKTRESYKLNKLEFDFDTYDRCHADK